MIPGGWKQIAQYLDCGVRTAQRWCGEGLLVRPLNSGPRSPVFAYSEQIDLWIKDGDLRQLRAAEVLEVHRRSSELVSEVRHARNTLRKNMAQLRKTIEVIKRAKQ